MKKTLTLLATAAMAFSVFATAAVAATKTTSDYKDLASADASLKGKVDALLAKGVFEGVSDDTFGITQNMTRAQFAKVASLVFGINVDTSVQSSSFTDVSASDPANGWAIPYIEAAKKAGLLEGMTATTFAPGDSVTVGQLDTVLVRGLGKKVDTTGTPWYSDAVKQATALGIHSDGKSGDAVAVRSDLVIGAYGSLEAAQPPKDQEPAPGTTTPTTPTTPSTGDGTTTPTAPVGTVSVKAGDLTYTLQESYEIGNVIEGGQTAAAKGTSGNVTEAVAKDPTLSMLAKELEIKVQTESGDEVAAPGLIQSLTSSNTNSVITGVAADHKGYILGNEDGNATVSIVFRAYNGEVKTMNVSVVVKNATVSAQTIEARKTSLQTTQTVSGSVYSAQFNAYELTDMIITDNFGTEYEKEEIQQYNFALNTVFFTTDVAGNSADGALGSVTIDADGTVHVTGNVTSFNLAAVVPNGNRTDAYVNVRR
jgi:hypothetical protein